MLTLLLIFVLLGFVLGVVLWFGALLIQNYFYEQVAEGLHWRAPAAGFALSFFFTFWGFLDYRYAGPRPEPLPFDTLFNFSLSSETTPPVPVMYAVRERSTARTRYRIQKLPGQVPNYQYVDDGNVIWPKGATRQMAAVIVPDGDQEITFRPDPDHNRWVEEGGRRYMDYDHPGMITTSRGGLVAANLLLNALHLGVWFVCLWLLMRFQWFHALVGAGVMWLGMTFLVLPFLLERARG